MQHRGSADAIHECTSLKLYGIKSVMPQSDYRISLALKTEERRCEIPYLM